MMKRARGGWPLERLDLRARSVPRDVAHLGVCMPNGVQRHSPPFVQAAGAKACEASETARSTREKSGHDAAVPNFKSHTFSSMPTASIVLRPVILGIANLVSSWMNDQRVSLAKEWMADRAANRVLHGTDGHPSSCFRQKAMRNDRELLQAILQLRRTTAAVSKPQPPFPNTTMVETPRASERTPLLVLQQNPCLPLGPRSAQQQPIS